MISFEFDPAKSQSNLEKHGIDIQGAQRLWSDPNLLEIEAKSDDELHFLMIGLIDDKYWSAVVIHRNGTIRLISARRSRRKEVEIYES